MGLFFVLTSLAAICKRDFKETRVKTDQLAGFYSIGGKI